MESKNKGTKPFLRWVGGKKWLVKTLMNITKDLEYEDYYEPFLGGGAIFLSMSPKNRVYLSDLNEELINTYKMVQKFPEEILIELKKCKNESEYYYRIRDTKYSDDLLRATRFIYLNKTSFNGIYRVNKQGKYNVPFGYRSTYSIDEENIRSVSESLKDVCLTHGDFFKYTNQIKKNDLIFLDPPYTTSHNDNGFIKYNQRLFSLNDQYRLRAFIDLINERGAYYILTNAAHEKIMEIFDQKDIIKCELVRSSLVGGKNATRGKIKEYMFTNIKRG